MSKYELRMLVRNAKVHTHWQHMLLKLLAKVVG
jgi:hypothetical protein